MDKRSILGFVLIGVILMAWLYFQSENPKKNEQKKQETQKTDTTKPNEKIDTTKKVIKKDTVQVVQPNTDFGTIFSAVEKGEEKNIIIETDKYIAELSSKGGSIKKFELKGFKTWNGYPVQLLKLDKGNDLNMIFNSTEGKMINTKDLFFKASYPAWERKILRKGEEFSLTFELPVKDSTNSKILKTYKFKNGDYMFGLNVELLNSKNYLSNYEYQLVWENSLKLTENRSDVEGNFAEAFSFMGSEIEVLDATKIGEQKNVNLTGNTDWVSSRVKYFTVFLISKNPKAAGTYIVGNRAPLPDEGFEESYSIALKMPVKNDQNEKYSFDVYLGPVDYGILKGYDMGMEKTMRFSLDFLVRPIAQYALLPFFLFIHNFISNWGIVIIIFSICMKILLTPFTRYQMKSMKKMSELQPKMNAMKEKYKDDPKKQQQMLMKLYKEEKINPAGGCLPLLLQMPILYALFGVFNSTIELRQANFGLWIHDLAVPDTILKLPFKIPLFGINELSGLALLLGITMFVQQKMTVKDPKQMAMVYMMPIMLTLLFATLPSGLNLYYFCFNLLSICEQIYVTKFKKKKEGDVAVNEKQQLKFKGKK